MMAVDRPRVTASSALPAPTTPPPTTSTSSSRSDILAIASARAAGDSAATTNHLRYLADIYPVEGALHRLLPSGVALLPLLVGPLRGPALGLVPVRLELRGGR